MAKAVNLTGSAKRIVEFFPQSAVKRVYITIDQRHHFRLCKGA